MPVAPPPTPLLALCPLTGIGALGRWSSAVTLPPLPLTPSELPSYASPLGVCRFCPASPRSVLDQIREGAMVRRKRWLREE